MKRDKKIYNEEDWFILNAGRLYLPTLNSNGEEVLDKYEKLGIKIKQRIPTECNADPGNLKAYFDSKHFNSQHDFVRGYHSVVVDENDNVVIKIWTKRMGMKPLEFECLEIYDGASTK